jgi:hypothetical protein
MLYYPQMSTGAIAQFPIESSVQRRTIVSETLGGARLKNSDPDVNVISWTLRYTGLTDVERTAVEQLFNAAEGRLHNFLFLDPSSNLLRWSKDLSRPVWRADPLLQLEECDGLVPPEKGTRAINGAQISQFIEQTVEAPGWYHYCLSVYAKSPTPTLVGLAIQTADGVARTQTKVHQQWKRCICSGQVQGTATEIACRIELRPGASVELFAPQCDAQPNPSPYMLTANRGGIYPKTRFSEDRLRFVANGMDDHAVTVRLFSRIVL